MDQSNRGSYRKEETPLQAFYHSCLGKLVIFGGLLVVLFFVAVMTKPTEDEMMMEMTVDKAPITALLTVVSSPLSIPLIQMNRKAIWIICIVCGVILSLPLNTNWSINRNPSRGGTGIRLNTARPRFICASIRNSRCTYMSVGAWAYALK